MIEQKVWGHTVRQKTYKAGSRQYKYYTEVTIDGKQLGDFVEYKEGAYGSTKKESASEALKIFTIRLAEHSLGTESHAELMGYKQV
jgi:hypothetical protein